MNFKKTKIKLCGIIGSRIFTSWRKQELVAMRIVAKAPEMGLFLCYENSCQVDFSQLKIRDTLKFRVR